MKVSLSGNSGRFLQPNTRLAISITQRPGFVLKRTHGRNESLRYSSTLPETPRDSNGALTGVQILDLSRVLAAPLCSQILADYGADVIKVEDVGRGDDTRYFQAKGIENYRPGTMEKLKIGYDTLKQVNPRIIHASVSGYGPSGPAAKRAGYDMIAGAEAGLLHLTGERNGPPVRPGLGLTDMSTGLFIHGAIVSALYARERTGKGQKIDASLFESQIALLINVGMTWLNLGQEAERWGTQHPTVVPYDAFKTKDLYLVCGATNDKQFETFCKILGLDHLPRDERFKTNADRVKHRDELFPLINEAILTKTTDEWLEAFEGTGMPYAPINTMERVFAHPQTKAREMVQNVAFDAAQSGNIDLIGPAVKFSDTKATIRQGPPLLGEHTKDVLGELGFSESDVKRLKEDKVI